MAEEANLEKADADGDEGTGRTESDTLQEKALLADGADGVEPNAHSPSMEDIQNAEELEPDRAAPEESLSSFAKEHQNRSAPQSGSITPNTPLPDNQLAFGRSPTVQSFGTSGNQAFAANRSHPSGPRVYLFCILFLLIHHLLHLHLFSFTSPTSRCSESISIMIFLF